MARCRRCPSGLGERPELALGAHRDPGHPGHPLVDWDPDRRSLGCPERDHREAVVLVAKISLGMIVRNEGRTLRACLESVAPHVDEIVIGLGGESSDDTEIIARDFTDKVIPITWSNDFSAARNVVLDAVTGDWFLWIDGDDVLLGGEHLHDLIDENPHINAFYMGYDYGRDEHNQTIVFLVRERLVQLQPQLENRGWRWIHPIHEVLVSEGFEQNRMLVENVKVVHHKPPFKHAPERNLEILQQMLEDSEPNPDGRILAYLGNELASRGQFQEAINHWNRFIAVSGFLEERYQTQHKIADVYRVMGKLDKALAADFNAVSMKPDWPDAYFGLAETYYHMGNPVGTIEMTKNGASRERQETGLITNPLDYTYYPFVVLGLAHVAVNDFQSALAMFEQAYQIKPEETLKTQILALREEMEMQDLKTAYLKVREHLGRYDQWFAARQLIDATPKALTKDPEIQQVIRRTYQQTAHIDDWSVMVNFYKDNPHWKPMPEETILDPRWMEYPRTKFARQIAERLDAELILDWGCSDGFIALPLAKMGYRVRGFDLDPRCVELANDRARRWAVPADFQVGDVNSTEVDYVADLALLFEVLEHVIDPADTLTQLEKSARHIAITTPYLAWEKGRLADWDKEEPKGHLRIFDLADIEMLLNGRGQIMNLYRQKMGESAWIFSDYKVGVKTDLRITVFAPGTVEEWDPQMWAREGLGGSETAIIGLTEAFAAEGHRPFVYGRIENPGYYNGVCYRPAETFHPTVNQDVLIAWRMPEVADVTPRAKVKILWVHDMDFGDRLTPARASFFDTIVVLTNWHKQHMLETYPFLEADQLVVIGNGVDPSRFLAPVQRNPHKIIYSSSPDRGLDIILNIWPKIIEAVPEAELHIFYGWNNFDKFMDQYPQLRAFKEEIMPKLQSLPGIVQHGRVNQTTLSRELLESSIWLYPTYFKETYCITAVEAQLAGVIPITNRLAALAETVRSGIIIDGDVRQPKVQEQYTKAVIDVLRTPLDLRESKHSQVRAFAHASSWTEVASRWIEVIRQARGNRAKELVAVGNPAIRGNDALWLWEVPTNNSNNQEQGNPLPVE